MWLKLSIELSQGFQNESIQKWKERTLVFRFSGGTKLYQNGSTYEGQLLSKCFQISKPTKFD